jgi:hypothetical protein
MQPGVRLNKQRGCTTYADHPGIWGQHTTPPASDTCCNMQQLLTYARLRDLDVEGLHYIMHWRGFRNCEAQPAARVLN